MFDILFKGECQPQQDVEMVKQNMARLFKISAEKVEGLFSGQSLTLKGSLEKGVADKYIQAIARAGAIAYAVESGGVTQPSGAAPAASVAEPEQVAEQATEQGQSDAVAEQVATGEQGTVLDAELDPAGTTLLEHATVQPPDIDTSQMSLSQPGEKLVEAVNTPDAEIVTDHLSLSEAGSKLVD